MYIQYVYCSGCTVPPKLQYAYLKNKVPPTVLIGERIEYVCDSGYYAPGIVTVECLGGQNVVKRKPLLHR